MNYWLMKTEPEEYSFEDLLRDKKTKWDGVRNYQAQNNMRAMRNGDQVLIYHSVGPKSVVGIAEVCKEHYADPTNGEKDKWILVEVKPVKALKSEVTLATIKETPALKDIALVRQARLSIMPLTKAEYDVILKLSNN